MALVIAPAGKRLPFAGFTEFQTQNAIICSSGSIALDFKIFGEVRMLPDSNT